MFSIMKLLENVDNFLSVGNVENKSNSRNKLFKSLIFLKSKGASYQNYESIKEFLNLYQYEIDCGEDFNFNFGEKKKKRIGKL